MKDDGRSRVGLACVLMLSALLAGAAVPRAGVAQEATPGTRIWLGLGFSTAAVRNVNANGGLGAELGVERGSQHFALRLLSLTDLDHFPEVGSERVDEAGVLYGRVAHSSWGHASIAAGLSTVTVRGYECGGMIAGTCRTVGIPLVAEAGLEGNLIGLALQAFGNLNSKALFGGFGLSLRLGWMP